MLVFIFRLKIIQIKQSLNFFTNSSNKALVLLHNVFSCLLLPHFGFPDHPSRVHVVELLLEVDTYPLLHSYVISTPRTSSSSNNFFVIVIFALDIAGHFPSICLSIALHTEQKLIYKSHFFLKLYTY